MAAYFCPKCRISYPAQEGFKVCTLHPDVKIQQYPFRPPDEDWHERHEALALEMRREEYLADVKIPVLNVPITEEDGRLFISQGDLIREKFRTVPRESFWLVQIGDTIYEAQGWHESGRRWWIEPVAPAVLLP